MTMSDFRKSRKMPWIKRGMRVYSIYKNKYGRISGANDSANLNITFDGATYSENCHPWWMIRYYDAKGKVLRDYRD